MINLKFDGSRRRSSIFVIGLLLVGGIVFGAASAARSLAQQDRLTPLQREIERQRQRLSSTEAEERRDALMRLGNLKRPDASRAAAAALSDVSAAVRVAAAHAVLSLPSAEAAAMLMPLLKDKDEFVRREAAFALGETHARTATTSLIDLIVHDKKPSVRAAAAVALGQIGDEAALSPLSQVVTGQGTKKKKTRSAEEEFVVRSAVRSLGQIRSRASVPALVAALQDETNSIETRREAATALGLIGDSSALPALQAAYETNSDPYLSEAARAAIRQINRAKPKGAGN
ncbi:MAG TPA: HEAT repeat domain-containing protein [Pyrinomonadaceae bacterium]|nr:HEAT repeat domain-containing protein [Pyrinomonadaceae bacterium]